MPRNHSHTPDFPFRFTGVIERHEENGEVEYFASLEFPSSGRTEGGHYIFSHCQGWGMYPQEALINAATEAAPAILKAFGGEHAKES